MPLASMLAKTEYPAARRDKERKAVQTSVVMPARITCFLPVASMAARKAGLSHALWGEGVGGSVFFLGEWEDKGRT